MFDNKHEISGEFDFPSCLLELIDNFRSWVSNLITSKLPHCSRFSLAFIEYQSRVSYQLLEHDLFMNARYF